MDINRMSKDELEELKNNLLENDNKSSENKFIEEGIVPVLGRNGTESIMATRDLETELSRLDEGYNNATKIFEQHLDDIETNTLDRDFEVEQLKQTKESLNNLLDDYERDRDSVLERFSLQDEEVDNEISETLGIDSDTEIEEDNESLE